MENGRTASRNAIFSGLFPIDLAALYPDEWRVTQDDLGRNRREHHLLDQQFSDLDPTLKLDTRYVKVLDIAEGNRLAKKVHAYRSFPLMAVVVNFLDMLTHGRSESELLQEMAPNEPAYRSLTRFSTSTKPSTPTAFNTGEFPSKSAFCPWRSCAGNDTPPLPDPIAMRVCPKENGGSIF